MKFFLLKLEGYFILMLCLGITKVYEFFSNAICFEMTEGPRGIFVTWNNLANFVKMIGTVTYVKYGYSKTYPFRFTFTKPKLFSFKD